MSDRIGIEFVFDTKPLSWYAERFPEKFQMMVFQAGSKARAKAIELVEEGDIKADKTGKLKQSLRVANRGRGIGAYCVLYSSLRAATDVEGEKGAPYPLYVHEGTGIFGATKKPIVPKKKGGWLVFPVESGGVEAKKGKYKGKMVVFARSVKGKKARPFFKKAIEWVLTPEVMEPIMRKTLGSGL